MSLIEDLDIYDLFRTVYSDGGNQSGTKNKIEGIKNKFKRHRKSYKGSVLDAMPDYVNRPDVR